MKKKDRNCSNCEWEKLFGCPLIDCEVKFTDRSAITYCSHWSISLNAYGDLYDKKNSKVNAKIQEWKKTGKIPI